MTLDELKALERAATPGPWEWETSDMLYSAKDNSYPLIFNECGGLLSPADAVFIAAARTRWPAALDRIEELESERRDFMRLAVAAEARCAALTEALEEIATHGYGPTWAIAKKALAAAEGKT